MDLEIWPLTMGSKQVRNCLITTHLTSPLTVQQPNRTRNKTVLCLKETTSSSILKRAKILNLRTNSRAATNFTLMICLTQNRTPAKKVIHSSQSKWMYLLSTQSRNNNSSSPSKMILILSRWEKMTTSQDQVSNRLQS